MPEEEICDMICEGLVDEREGQKFYQELARKLDEEGFPEEAETIDEFPAVDEKQHENYLTVLQQAHECICKR